MVTGGSADRVAGDWGEAVMLAFRYTHPRAGADVEVRQAVRVPRDLPFDLTIGARLELVCWGAMPSGMRRAPERRTGTGPARRRESHVALNAAGTEYATHGSRNRTAYQRPGGRRLGERLPHEEERCPQVSH